MIRWRAVPSLLFAFFRFGILYRMPRIDRYLRKSPAIVALIRSQAAWTAAQAAYLDTFHSSRARVTSWHRPSGQHHCSGNPRSHLRRARLLVEPPQVLPTLAPFLLVQTSHQCTFLGIKFSFEFRSSKRGMCHGARFHLVSIAYVFAMP